MQRALRIRPLPPVVALVALFIAVVAFSLVHAARESNRLDSAKARTSATSAIAAQVDQLVSLADDNGIWDDAARMAYGSGISQDFFWNAWGVVTAEGQLYDSAIVIDAQNVPMFAYVNGRAVRIDIATKFGSGLGPLIAKAKRDRRAHGGILRTDKGIAIVAVSPILPTSGALIATIPATGPSILIYSRSVDEIMLAQIAASRALPQLAIAAPGEPDDAIILRNPAGAAIGALSWRSTRIGYVALGNALPIIIFASLIHVFFAMVLVLRAYRSVKTLESEALVDSLSLLPNRRALRDELTDRLAHGEKLALAMIDLDGFKMINDAFGHGVGDRLLKAVAELLTGLVGTKGTVARLGGDEFAILINGSKSVSVIDGIAQALLARLAEPFKIDERTVIVGASIGLASVSLYDTDAGEFMRRADVAMYAAKRAGKMRLCWFDEMLDQRRVIAQTIEIELRAAIETETFEVVYQPIVSAQTRAIVGVEALLRWISPSRGEVGPAEFIPVAEESGLIDRIGNIALRKVCVDGHRWPDLEVSINVSPSQLRNPNFIANLSNILYETEFPAGRLTLEITETYLLYDPDIALKTVRAIKSLGVGIALDDLGTGYASLGFLSRFQLDKVKIDGKMIVAAHKSEAGLVMLNSTIAVIRALGMKICAEGIEAEPQADLMRAAGCDHLQGWHFSRAVPASQIRLPAEIPDKQSPFAKLRAALA